MKLLQFISRLMFYLSAFVCIPAIFFVLIVDVTLRFGFNAPMRWAQEFASILLFVSIALVLPESWLRHAHIRADFLQHVVSRRAREVLARLSWLLVIGLSAAIIWQCRSDIQYMLLISESTPELYVPMAWLRGVLALGAAVSGLIAIFKLFSRQSLADETEGSAQ